MIQINATIRRSGFYWPDRQEESLVITYDIDREKWAQVAAECRRLAGLTVDEWMRAELLRSARFYDNLSTGFSRCDPRAATGSVASRAAN